MRTVAGHSRAEKPPWWTGLLLSSAGLGHSFVQRVEETLSGTAFLRDWRREVAAGLWTKHHHPYVLRLGVGLVRE